VQVEVAAGWVAGVVAAWVPVVVSPPDVVVALHVVVPFRVRVVAQTVPPPVVLLPPLELPPPPVVLPPPLELPPPLVVLPPPAVVLPPPAVVCWLPLVVVAEVVPVVEVVGLAVGDEVPPARARSCVTTDWAWVWRLDVSGK
jgi:hypothetical protein